jgi:hypothetical protein
MAVEKETKEENHYQFCLLLLWVMAKGIEEGARGAVQLRFRICHVSHVFPMAL